MNLLKIFTVSLGIWAGWSLPAVAEPLSSEINYPEWLLNKQSGWMLGGYDPVSYFPPGYPDAIEYEQERHSLPEPVAGKDELTVTVNGAKFRFANQENKDRFLRNPELFFPAFGGWGAAAMAPKLMEKVDARVAAVLPDLENPQRLKLFVFSKAAYRDHFVKFYEDLGADAMNSWRELVEESVKWPGEVDAFLRKYNGKDKVGTALMVHGFSWRKFGQRLARGFGVLSQLPGRLWNSNEAGDLHQDPNLPNNRTTSGTEAQGMPANGGLEPIHIPNSSRDGVSPGDTQVIEASGSATEGNQDSTTSTAD